MTREGEVHASRSADTEVFYMAGKQLAALARRLLGAGWPVHTPVSVVSRAGWPDQLHSDHTLDGLSHASVLHAGRPTLVTVGAGAAALDESAVSVDPHSIDRTRHTADLPTDMTTIGKP